MATLNSKVITPLVPRASAPRLLDRVRDKLRLKHYSIRTEDAYVGWIKRFIRFHDKRHPSTMGAAEVEAFLTHLAVEGKVSASTQNMARTAPKVSGTRLIQVVPPSSRRDFAVDRARSATRPATRP
jgi:hypothetical protein